MKPGQKNAVRLHCARKLTNRHIRMFTTLDLASAFYIYSVVSVDGNTTLSICFFVGFFFNLNAHISMRVSTSRHHLCSECQKITYTIVSWHTVVA